jgi:hypothetical protein
VSERNENDGGESAPDGAAHASAGPPAPLTPPAPPAPAPLPPLVAWVSRNSGWLILLTVLAVALIEGVGLFYFKRRANAADCTAVQVQASSPADSLTSGSDDPRCSGARE